MRPFLERLLDFVLERVDFESLFRFLLERLGLPEAAVELILDLVSELFAQEVASAGLSAPPTAQSLLDRAEK